jgi:hypothetical protein
MPAGNPDFLNFIGTIEFSFKNRNLAENFVGQFPVGLAGQPGQDWPHMYNLATEFIDEFEVIRMEIAPVPVNNVKLTIKFKVNNNTNSEYNELVENVIEDFDTLAGIDANDWFIISAVAEPIAEPEENALVGGRRKCKRYATKKNKMRVHNLNKRLKRRKTTKQKKAHY